jgi:hypothetical protein
MRSEGNQIGQASLVGAIKWSNQMGQASLM